MRVARWLLPLLAALTFAAPADALTLSQHDAAEAKLVHRVNHVRANHHLAPLKVAFRLGRAATRHSNSMAKVGYFRHELRYKGTWKTFAEWISWYWPGPGYGSWSAGENLAWGAPALGVRKTVSLWMHSPGHRANLLSPNWSRIGVAVVHVADPVGYYQDSTSATIVTTDFGGRSR